MTRINLVPPTELTDQHLIAEYREIFMVPAALRRSLQSRAGFNPRKIPRRFCLNAGHVYFFYDKGRYLHRRYRALCAEMRRRGFRPDAARRFPKQVFAANGLYRDWRPQAADLRIIRARLRAKVAQKPDWYRKTRGRT